MWTLLIQLWHVILTMQRELQFPANKNKKIQLDKSTAEYLLKNSKRHEKNFLDSSKSTVLGFLKQLHFKHIIVFYVEQDLLERLTDCISDYFFL